MKYRPLFQLIKSALFLSLTSFSLSSEAAGEKPWNKMSLPEVSKETRACTLRVRETRAWGADAARRGVSHEQRYRETTVTCDGKRLSIDEIGETNFGQNDIQEELSKGLAFYLGRGFTTVTCTQSHAEYTGDDFTCILIRP